MIIDIDLEGGNNKYNTYSDFRTPISRLFENKQETGFQAWKQCESKEVNLDS